MANKKSGKKKTKVKDDGFSWGKFFGYFARGVWEFLKFPYYYVRWAYKMGTKISKKEEEIKMNKRRKKIGSVHEEFRVVHVVHGDYFDWLNHVSKSDSQIGIILGARGTGKTAFGVKFLENLHAQYNKKCFAMGFAKADMPSWIEVVLEIDEIANDSVVLIDEGGILFNSRDSMSNANKLLSSLMMIARHKNISILFISQNSSNLEVNVLRQADFLVLKPSSLLQEEFERKVVQKIYGEAREHFEKFSEDEGLVHIYSGKFRGFVSNPLPSFWGEKVSKSFR